MIEPVEIKLSKAVEEWLCSKGLFPFDVLFTRTPKQLLKISFILKSELTEFLDCIGYNNLADKSGITICSDEITILFTDMSLKMLYKCLMN